MISLVRALGGCSLLVLALAATLGMLALGCGAEPIAGECANEPGDVLHSATYVDELAWPYQPDQLVADADYVYFADGRGIHRVARCGGPAELLIADARPFNDGLALADGRLYWLAGDDGVDGPRVQRASSEGGPVETLAVYEGYSHQLRVDGGVVVWNASVSGFPDESRLLAVSVEGGTPELLAAHRYGWSFDLADGVVYAAGYLPGSDPASSDRVLFALPADGGVPEVLADGFGDEYPSNPVVGGEYVYYLRRWSSDPLAVERVARAGGPIEPLGIVDPNALDHLLHTGDALYGVEIDGEPVRLEPGAAPIPLLPADSLAVASRAFADPLGLLVADSTTTCVETWTDPSGEPPGPTCVRERVDVRVLWVGL